MVDEDELEGGVLRVSRDRRGQSGAHDHSLLCRQRAGRLRLGRAGLDLAEAHAASTDGCPKPWLVTEDGNLDPGRESSLDEPGPLRHLDRDAVDREPNQLGRAHA